VENACSAQRTDTEATDSGQPKLSLANRERVGIGGASPDDKPSSGRCWHERLK